MKLRDAFHQSIYTCDFPSRESRVRRYTHSLLASFEKKKIIIFFYYMCLRRIYTHVFIFIFPIIKKKCKFIITCKIHQSGLWESRNYGNIIITTLQKHYYYYYESQAKIRNKYYGNR